MKFAKVVNGSLEFAPKKILRDGRCIFTNSVEEYAALGYKPIELTEAPAEREGFDLHYTWVEDETCCKQVWIETEQVIANTEELEDMQSALTLLGVTPEVDDNA